MKRLALVGVAAVALGGCSFAGKTHQSSPARLTDTSPGNVVQFPSGFRNVAYKCVNVQGEWFAVFSGSSSGNDAVSIWPDPKCTHPGS